MIMPVGPVSGSRYMARLRATGADWGLDIKNSLTASACNNPSDSVTEIVRLEQFDYYNQKQNEVYTLTWRIWTSCPQLYPASFSRARLTGPIFHVSPF